MNLTWLKLNTGILDDDKIKLLRKYPDGDSIFTLWVGLLCLAMKGSKPGLIEITDGIPYSAEDISSTLEIPLKTVEMSIELFCRFKMIEIIEGNTIEIINFGKHQSLDRIEEKRKLNNERQRKHRAKKRNALLTCDVTQSNATDIDIDKELDKDKDIYISNKGDKSLHGEFVKLSDKEYQTLCTDYTEKVVKQTIDNVNGYISYLLSIGKTNKYKDYKRTIVNFIKKDMADGKIDSKEQLKRKAEIEQENKADESARRFRYPGIEIELNKEQFHHAQQLAFIGKSLEEIKQELGV